MQITEDAHHGIDNGKQLLAGDVVEIIEPFAKGEVFEILDNNQRSVAVARSLISSKRLGLISKNSEALAQPEEIILL